MTRDEMHALFDYHYWATHRLLDAVGVLSAEDYTRPLGGSFGCIRDTVVHVLLADEIWCARWEGRPISGFEPYDSVPDVPAARARWRALEPVVHALVDELGEDGLQRTFSYRLRNGTPGTSTYTQVMQHVVNHGSYHRGQVVTLLRQIGAAPPASLDLVAFHRLRATPPDQA